MKSDIMNLRACPIINPKIVEKGWGKEIWIENNDKYCGKLLIFDKGKKFSMHYHLLKEETWYISKGRFIYKTIDLGKAKENEYLIEEGTIIHLCSGQPHQLQALTQGATVFEISTTHYDEDSYRIQPGDSQIKNLI